MKKITLPLFLVLVLIAGLISCESGQDTASLRVILDQNSSRIIVPEEVPLEVRKYRIEGTGPSDSTFSIITSKTNATLDGLAIGEWTLKATGLNEKDQEIVQGSTTFNLSASNTSCVIVLKELVGKGNLEVELNWDTARITNPRLEAEITRQGEEEATSLEVRNFNSEKGTALILEENLDSGSYILQGRLYSNSTLVSGFVEAVRIVGGAKSAKAIELALDRFPSSPGSLQLINEAGLPVECTIAGIEGDEVEANKNLTVTLEPRDSSLKNISAKWYLDGVYQADGLSYTIAPSPGLHRLDVVASTNKIGSYGSSGINFNAVLKTNPGIPGNGKTFTTSSGLDMNSTMLIHHLPDGKFLNIGKGYMQLCVYSRNNVEVIREYNTGSFPFLNGTPASCMSRSINGSNAAIILALNNPTKTVHLNYDMRSYEITLIEDDKGYDADMEGKRKPMEYYYRFNGFDVMYGCFTYLGKVQNGGFCVNLRQLGDDALLDNGEYYGYESYNYTEFVDQFLEMELKDVTCYGLRSDAENYVLGTADGTVFDMRPLGYPADFPCLATIMPDLESSKYVGLEEIVVSQDDMIFFAGRNYLASYDWRNYRETCHIPEAGGNITDIEYLDATNMLYALDKETQAIHVYNVDPVTSKLEFNTSVSLEEGYDSMHFSPGGDCVYLYNRDAATTLTIMKIVLD